MSRRGSVLHLPAPRTLYLFDEGNRIREWCTTICNSKWFNNFMLLCIAYNCIILVLEAQHRNPSAAEYDMINISDKLLASIFIVEMLMKVVSQGFLMAGPGSYLRDHWNQLDFVVVILAILSFVPGFGNYSYIRSIRLLRPLKAATALPGVRAILEALFSSMSALGNVCLLLFILFFMYGLFGMQLFRGQFTRRCWDPTRIAEIDQQTLNFGSTCSNRTFGWSLIEPRHCPSGTACIDFGQNPYFGVIAFDNILQSMMMMFISVTGESWSSIMDFSSDSVS